MTILFANIASVICLLIAGYLAIHQTEGWGWFLFAAVLLYGSVKIKKSDKNEETTTE